MHKNPFRKDVEATKAMHFESRYSYVSLRQHPGSDHACQYLAGLIDIGIRRTQVFMRDEFRCASCGEKVDTNIPSWHPDSAHLAHGGHSKVTRCWCLENLSLKHKRCHGANDHHGRF